MRRKILKRLARLRAVPQEAVAEMPARPHGGFSLNAEVGIGAQDRAGLARLLSYCLRPVVSLKRLRYDAAADRVFYRPIKRRPGDPDIFHWSPLAFIKRLAPIELIRGAKVPISRPAVLASRTAQAAATAASKAWAACLKKVFEVNPILCRNCGVEMEPVAAIVADAQLVRLLAHLRLPTEFPKTKPARSPPLPLCHESQIDPSVDAAEGIDEDRGWHAA